MKTILMSLLLATAATLAHGEVKSAEWGQMDDGSNVQIYTLSSKQLEVRVSSYGAHLVSIKSPDRNGRLADVVLGFDSLNEYYKMRNPYLGAAVGRYANRIGQARFTLDGQEYKITVTNGPHALHGGAKGFDKLNWTSRRVPNGVEFELVSPDGDMGFPGKLTARVRYTVKGGDLRIDYEAVTGKPTVVNLTNHAYFNLHGDDQGEILDHQLQINAASITSVDQALIPTGTLTPVAGTALDFRKPTAIGARIHTSEEPVQSVKGYDFNYVLDGKAGTLRKAVIVTDPVSGRRMTVKTTEPGVQFYSGNTLRTTNPGRHGIAYTPYSAFCMETQHFPDSPNHANFPSTVLRPGQTMHSTTIYAFSVAH